MFLVNASHLPHMSIPHLSQLFLVTHNIPFGDFDPHCHFLLDVLDLCEVMFNFFIFETESGLELLDASLLLLDVVL